jgi:hypothetical protein
VTAPDADAPPAASADIDWMALIAAESGLIGKFMLTPCDCNAISKNRRVSGRRSGASSRFEKD